MSNDPNSADDLVILGSMYATTYIELMLLRQAAEGAIRAIVPHPNFQRRTRLVWAAELEALAKELDKLKAGDHLRTSDALASLRSKSKTVLSLEEARTVADDITMIRKLRGPEAKEILEKLKQLTTPVTPQIP